MIAHYGCSEDESAVIDVLPPCSVSCVACLSFEVDHLFSGQPVLWNQKVVAFIAFYSIVSLRKIAVMHWSELKSYNKPFELLHSLDSGFGANDPDIVIPFAKAGCLQQLSSLSASHSMNRL